MTVYPESASASHQGQTPITPHRRFHWRLGPMIPRTFEYSAPSTLNEAISLLQKLGPDAKILSGGQSLIPMMKLRLASPPHIVDITRIPGLDYIKEEAGTLRIGALVRE